MKDEEALHVKLDAVENEIAEFTAKYGTTYEQFIAKFECGELGDPYSYELERDAMRWESIIAEKKLWLEQLQKIEGLAPGALRSSGKPSRR
jgi:hypothetical protein